MIVNQPLTRRAKEYFEVLDQLRNDGFLTHEEWITASNSEIKKHKRMTNSIIEDALVSNGYSKGSPNELKKYRTQWMEARGIEVPEIEYAVASRPSLSVNYTASALQNHLKKTAQVTESELRKSNQNLDRLKAELDSMRQALEEVNDKANRLFQENIQYQSQLVQEKNKRFAADSRYEGCEKSFKQFKEETNQNFESLQQINESSLKYLQDENKRLKESYQQELKRLQEFHEGEGQLKLELQSLRHLNSAQKDQIDKLQQALTHAHIKISKLENQREV